MRDLLISVILQESSVISSSKELICHNAIVQNIFKRYKTGQHH